MLNVIPVLIGLLLGLLGGGGSVLAVPALIYFYGLETKTAITASLLVVGISSFLVSIKPFLGGRFPLRKILAFTVFAILGAFLSAKFISGYLSNQAQLLAFAVLIIVIGFLMLVKIEFLQAVPVGLIDFFERQSWLLAFGVGIITGLVGVGGGFLLVPSLHYFLKLPLRSAIETSLIIIALQSMSAFAGYILSVKLDYLLLLPFILWVLVGIFIGQFFRNKINESWLKKSFGTLLVVLGLIILLYNYN
jgi:uncharacterized membrane protein YfcA